MQKKTYLLSNLKKQVIALKTQLERLQKQKAPFHKCQHSYSKHHNQSITHSSRFDSVSFDGYDLDRGKKKFRESQSPYKNLVQVIRQKSAIVKRPTPSMYRKAEHIKTCQNFSSQTPEYSKSRSRSPNPITGEGYMDSRRGIKIIKRQKVAVVERPSNRRHFNFYY